MKRIFAVVPLLLLLALLPTAVSCRHNSIEPAIKEALLSGDTTQERFDSICSMILRSPERYSTLVTDQGEINLAALNALIEKVGSDLRPPMHWNVASYGRQALSLTVYFERSGSMVPYDGKGGKGMLKKAVNDLINHFPTENVTIKVVNDNIYDYTGTVEQFLTDRDIYGSTAGIGNAAYTDFKQIFNSILTANKPGNIAVVVTDLIYSPADTKNVSVDKILNEENSIAMSIFKKNGGKSVIIHRLTGDYNGKYYPYNNNPVVYKGNRPFFLVVIADNDVLDYAASSTEYNFLLHPDGATHSYRFNQGESRLDYSVVPGWKDDAGRYRIAHKGELRLERCEPDKQTDKFSFTIAVNLAPLQQSEAYLKDPANYTVRCQSDFKLAVTPITDDMVAGNVKQWLAGKTHLLTLTGKLARPRDEVSITLRNDFPAWVEKCSTNDDTKPNANTTFGLEQWLRGMQAGFSRNENYGTITVKLDR